MIKLNNSKIDYRVYLIRNKIIEINNSIKSLENQINNIKNDIYFTDDYIRDNNFSLIKSLIYHYKGQKYFLISKLGEYYSIMSNNNIKEKTEFLEIWKQQVDTMINDNYNFSFRSDENIALENEKKLVNK